MDQGQQDTEDHDDRSALPHGIRYRWPLENNDNCQGRSEQEINQWQGQSPPARSRLQRIAGLLGLLHGAFTLYDPSGVWIDVMSSLVTLSTAAETEISARWGHAWRTGTLVSGECKSVTEGMGAVVVNPGGTTTGRGYPGQDPDCGSPQNFRHRRPACPRPSDPPRLKAGSPTAGWCRTPGRPARCGRR